MAEPEDRTYPFEGIEVIHAEVLETFPFDNIHSGGVAIDTDEFTAVCPYSGLPDFGTLVVRYVPADRCLELKSLKYYLLSYRNVGIYQEHAAERILTDLVAACKPEWMEVILDYRLRGGIHTVVTVSHGEPPTELVG